jgi:hypothetical protein
MQPRRKHYLAHIPLIVLFCLLAVFPQLAIVLFILRYIDRRAEKREETEASFPQNSSSTRFNVSFEREHHEGNTSPQTPYTERTQVKTSAADLLDHPTAEQNTAKKRHEQIITLCTILGAVFLAFGVTQLVDALEWLPYVDGYWRGFFSDLVPALAQLIGGGGALFVGLRMKRTRKLEQQMDKVVGIQDNIPLNELFAAVGVSEAQGRSVLDAAIDHGYFGADAYIDNRTNTLVVRGAAPAPAAPTEPKQEESHTPAGENEYARLLRELREVNDSIADPIMSAKIDRLEHVAARIFEQAERTPAKRPQLKRFTDYYLPTALRLLRTYAQLSHQQVQGQNITEAKQSIENSMDMLVNAFENQLDKLFQSDALDVSADVAALQGMLNMDGLTEDGLFSTSETPR